MRTRKKHICLAFVIQSTFLCGRFFGVGEGACYFRISFSGNKKGYDG